MSFNDHFANPLPHVAATLLAAGAAAALALQAGPVSAAESQTLLPGDREIDSEAVNEPFENQGESAPRGSGGIWRVGPSSDGDCHFDNIQDAIDATAGLGSDWSSIQIRVAGPDSLYLGQTNSISLDAIENVTEITIDGGYDSCSGPSSGTTVLDADGGTRVFNISNSAGYDGPQREITLRNLVIQGASHAFSFGGGGILVNGTPGRLSVKLENVTLQNNHANASSGGGGGVMVRVRAERIGGGTMLTADNDTIVANNTTAGNGGGVACRSLVGGTGTSTLIRWGAGPIASNQAENGGAISIEDGCSRNFFYNGAFLAGIFNNQAADAGGAAYVAGDGSHLAFRGDEFEGFGNASWRLDIVNNQAVRGGGLYVRDASEVFLSDVNLSNNSAETAGGIYANAGEAMVSMGRISNTPCDDATFGRCSLARGNSATNGSGGAFNARNDATIEVSRTFIENNSATSRGSIASVSGAGPGTVILESVLATGNHGAPELLFAFHGSIQVRYSTLADNEDLVRSAYAQAASPSQPATIGLFSSILWESGGIVADEGNEDASITGDCVIGWQEPEVMPVDDSISFYRSVNPLFLDPANDDYRPGPVSPAIDFCDDEVTPPEFRDLDGNIRGTAHQGSPVMPGGPNLGPFDLGAYETDWDELTDQIFHDRLESQ